MARFRRVNTDQLESDLTDIANAIRAKAGTTAELPFPFGYISAVNSLTSGSGSGSTSDIESEVAVQTDLIQQIKEGLAETEENLARTGNEISTQSALIQQIKAVLAEKGYQTAEE